MVRFRIALTLPFLRSSLKGPPTLPAWILVFSIPSGLLLSMIWSGYVITDMSSV